MHPRMHALHGHVEHADLDATEISILVLPVSVARPPAAAPQRTLDIVTSLILQEKESHTAK